MNIEEFRKVIEIEGLEVTVDFLILQGPVFYFHNDSKKYFNFKKLLSKKLVHPGIEWVTG
jgi:Pyruvate/2-oxoacid:ferredoxin oxidoreductase gamma subunit